MRENQFHLQEVSDQPLKNGQIDSNELTLKIGAMGSTMDSKMVDSASNQNSDSVRLLADFRLC